MSPHSTLPTSPPPQNPIPSSVLILGSGLFGLSTAYALSLHASFAHTQLTLVDRLSFPAPDAASIDSSRIVRADYPDEAYARLMAEGMPLWRQQGDGEWGGEGRYTESGLCLVTEETEEEPGEKNGDGSYYVGQALKNVTDRLGLKLGRREDGGEVEVLPDVAAVQRVVGERMGGECGQRGYVNWTSGWADAEAAMKHLRQKVEKAGRVAFRTAAVKRLHYDAASVTAVELETGELLHADLTVLATGAWTPRFLDLRGIASATGQVLAYTSLTDAEQAVLGANPTLLNESNGMFIIQPRNRVLKVARHGCGYANPTTIPHPELPAEAGETITVSLPRTAHDDPTLSIPPEGDRTCREYLRKTIPALAERPWTNTRICWYCDTRKGDWLIGYHPRYQNLFVATGGSGHAFKFLPVIGGRIVDVILGRDRDELGRVLREQWAWPKERMADDHVWTEDWRGGRKGMVLAEEMGRA